MNAMENFCADQQAKIDELQSENYEEQRAHADELLKLNIELVCAKSELKAARYKIESLERIVETLQLCIDNEAKRRMERLKL